MSARESLLLKWGTLKGWDLKTDASRSAFREYVNAGEVSGGAMTQRDTAAQKAAIIKLIDVLDGDIENDWTGEALTKDEAKAYVMEYGR